MSHQRPRPEPRPGAWVLVSLGALGILASAADLIAGHLLDKYGPLQGLISDAIVLVASVFLFALGRFGLRRNRR
jgi:MFS family permease